MHYNSQFSIENLERAKKFDIPEWGFETWILKKTCRYSKGVFCAFPAVLFWVSWWQNESFWKSITCNYICQTIKNTKNVNSRPQFKMCLVWVPIFPEQWFMCQTVPSKPSFNHLLSEEIQIILRLFLVIANDCQASSSQFNQSLNLPSC